MADNNLPVDYFAYANPNDRDMSGIIVKKQSIAAPLLAVGREGAVIPFGFDTQWNIPFYHSDETTTRPSGAPSGDKWLTGSMTPVTSTYDFIITIDIDEEDNDIWRYCNIDFNDDGDYGDSGEGPFIEAGNEVEFDGIRYQLVMGEDNTRNDPGDIKLKYPCVSDMVDELKSYIAVMDSQPEHLCIVGLFDVIPFGTTKYWGGGTESSVNDGGISNVDDDEWLELATGRVFGENMSFGTLLAARSLTYDYLVSPEWADKSLLMGGGSLDSTRFVGKYLENVGFEPAHVIDREFGDENLPYMLDRSVIAHSWHSTEVSWGWGPNYFVEDLSTKPNLDNIFLSPCVATSGGCTVAGIDIDYYSWDRIIAPKFLRRGAIAYIGSSRPATGVFNILNTEFFNALAAGKTLGQAWKQAQNMHRYRNKVGMGSMDDANTFAFFGDPGLKIYLPSEPITEPAHLERSGSILTAVAPVYTSDTYEGKYTYYGPGTYEGGNYFARWDTDLQITGLTELVSCPGDLGWPGSNDWFIDEHWDGTRSIYWKVKFFEQPNYYEPTITYQLDEISYKLTGSIPGDLNMTGIVDLVDFSQLANEWMSTNCQSSAWCQGTDLDESGQVDLYDLSVITDHWLDNTFTNQTGSPRVVNLITSNITTYGATINGQVIYNGTDDPTVDIYWGDSDGGTSTTPGIWDHQIDLGTQGVGTFHADICGLDQDTTYYFRCYASNSFGADWANTTAKFTAEPFPPIPMIESQSTDWHYRKGTSEPPSDWREIGFTEDETWLIGQTSIGFGDGDDNTVLDDMQDNYTTVYLRHAFEIDPSGGIPDTLTLRVYVDDGCIVSINGHEVYRLRVLEGDMSYNSTGQWIGNAEWSEYIVKNASEFLTAGTNILAIHVLNTSAGSSDLSIDAELSRPPLSMAEYLQGHWQLDELSGTVAADSSGNGNDGTLRGDPTWRPSGGKIGGALEFNGTGDYVEIEGYKGISGSNPRTVTAWVRDGSNESNLAIVSWGTLGTSGAQWFNGITAEGKLQAAVWGSSILGDTEIDDDTWHHVAIVLPDKEIVKVEDILLYVDGEQENTTVSNGAQTIDTSVDMDVLISTDGSEGLLDDVRIYKYMLREDDIQALADGT